MKGHMGKILRVDLTNQDISTIDTSEYEEWVGGHGMGSAIFFDLVDDKSVDAFSEENIITMMATPLAGTLAPAASSRTEVQGNSPQPYPHEWFTRSNFGGRFSPMMKYAGYDGVVIEGKADEPVWVNVVDSEARFEDASNLWGLGTWETQEEIWSQVGTSGWTATDNPRDMGETTQKPAIATIGPAGEKQTRIGTIQHDAGNSAGNAGFGGVLGFKNLKAISFLGTGSVEMANPNDTLESRLWAEENYAYHEDEDLPLGGFWGFGATPGSGDLGGFPKSKARAQGCIGCHKNCRKRYADSVGNESQCVEAVFYNSFDAAAHGNVTKESAKATDITQKMGINAYSLSNGLPYLENLYEKGILGPDGEIEADLPWDLLGESKFVDVLVEKIVNREGIGEDLAEGFPRAAERWGRFEQDTADGTLGFQYWGYPHHYDARAEVEWGYGSILGARDINEHDFNWPMYWEPTLMHLAGAEPPLDAETLAEYTMEATPPHNVKPDYSDENIYSRDMAELVSWHRSYTRFWKQTVQYCDWAYTDFVNPNTEDMSGLTPEGEPRIFNAVTGAGFTFEDGIELGNRIWNLDRAIWTLQGRHRDQEEFAEYTYEITSKSGIPESGVVGPHYMPVRRDGEWTYEDVSDRSLDREKFNEWKTIYYELEGWDPETGWPTRDALEKHDLGYVADELEAKGKIPQEA